MNCPEFLAPRISRLIHFTENGFLLRIAIFTTIGMCQEIYAIIAKRNVALHDLL